MPSKNRLKTYVADGYYHLYNRGVEKRLLFQDQQDYHVFLLYISQYLLPKDKEALEKILVNDTSEREKEYARKLLRLNNFSESLYMVAFCLMPNHFHFLVKQTEEHAIDSFMNSLCTRYTMFFNKKYKRVGSLYQDVYKAVIITSDEQFLHLSRYIHRNPCSLFSNTQVWQTYEYSSLLHYTHQKNISWIHSEWLLTYFSSQKNTPHQSYQQFVLEKDTEYSQTLLAHGMIDEL